MKPPNQQQRRYILTFFIFTATLATNSLAITSFRRLDRLYFSQLSNRDLIELRQISVNLGPKRTIDQNGACIANDSYDYYICRDFALRKKIHGHQIVIRELIRTGSRVQRLWWILYENNILCDAWQYTPAPSREGKLLTNYQIVSIDENSTNGIKIKIEGYMFPNNGNWIEKGVEVNFLRSEGAIRFHSAINSFTFSNIEDGNSKASTVRVSTEEPAKNGILNKTINFTSSKSRNFCGFQDPSLDEHWTFNWQRMRKIAKCLTSDSAAKITLRSHSTATFIEK